MCLLSLLICVLGVICAPIPSSVSAFYHACAQILLLMHHRTSFANIWSEMTYFRNVLRGRTRRSVRQITLSPPFHI